MLTRHSVMPETVIKRSRRGPATAETVEALHEDVDGLWAEAGFVAEGDRMAFTLAVIEAVTNVVDHAVPSDQDGVILGVELLVSPRRLQAEIYEINAQPASLDLDQPRALDALTDSGRGLELIRRLVDTVLFERHDDTNVWVLTRNHGH